MKPEKLWMIYSNIHSKYPMSWLNTLSRTRQIAWELYYSDGTPIPKEYNKYKKHTKAVKVTVTKGWE